MCPSSHFNLTKWTLNVITTVRFTIGVYLVKSFFNDAKPGHKKLEVKKALATKEQTVLTLLVPLKYILELKSESAPLDTFVRNGQVTNLWKTKFDVASSNCKHPPDGSSSDPPIGQFIIENDTNNKNKMTLKFNNLFKYAIIRAENGNMFNTGTGPLDKLGLVSVSLEDPCSSICFASGTKI